MAYSMVWHEDGRTKDGLLRHPADSFAWKDFDRQYPDFSCDSHNVRLGLASDGFNPFKTMTISHSTWPVILIPYNLLPWMCMKQPNFITFIDVYMQPLVEEFKELWEIGGKHLMHVKKSHSKCVLQLCGLLIIFLLVQICLVEALKVNMFVHVVVLRLAQSGCIMVERFAICVIVVS